MFLKIIFINHTNNLINNSKTFREDNLLRRRNLPNPNRDSFKKS